MFLSILLRPMLLLLPPLPPPQLQLARMNNDTRQRLISVFWVLVKEFDLSYHNRDPQQTMGFRYFGNLD